MLSSVFCSRMSCGWISTLKRREISNSRSSTVPKEISFSGLLKIGSHTVRIADSISSTREPSGTQPDSRCSVRDLAVVAIEHRQEILGEVVLVARIERADDAEIHRGVLRLRRIVDEHEDVARVHVGVEEVVPEHLREEDLHAVLRQLADVGAGFAQARHVGDLHAADALHDHDAGPAEIPVHRGHI